MRLRGSARHGHMTTRSFDASDNAIGGIARRLAGWMLVVAAVFLFVGFGLSRGRLGSAGSRAQVASCRVQQVAGVASLGAWSPHGHRRSPALPKRLGLAAPRRASSKAGLASRAFSGVGANRSLVCAPCWPSMCPTSASSRAAVIGVTGRLIRFPRWGCNQRGEKGGEGRVSDGLVGKVSGGGRLLQEAGLQGWRL